MGGLPALAFLVAQLHPRPEHPQARKLRQALGQQHHPVPKPGGAPRPGAGEQLLEQPLELGLLPAGEISCKGSYLVNIFPHPLELGHEMPLAAVHGVDAPHRQALHPRAAKPGLDGEQGELRVGGEEPADVVLVLLPGEGAGGVHQHAPLPHRQGRGIQNGPLALGAGGGALRAPLGHGGRVPAEHALPGAGGVHQHLVKEALEALAQPLGVAGGHHGVWHPQTFHVGEQRLGPGFHNLVGPEQPLPGQQPGNLGGLAPGGGAQIQHLLPGLGVQHRDRRAGRGLLHVEQPGVVGGQAAHTLLPGGEGVAQGGERRGLQGKGQRRLQLGLAALEGVAAQAPAGGLLIALEKGGVLCPQKPLHGL